LFHNTAQTSSYNLPFYRQIIITAAQMSVGRQRDIRLYSIRSLIMWQKWRHYNSHRLSCHRLTIWVETVLFLAIAGFQPKSSAFARVMS